MCLFLRRSETSLSQDPDDRTHSSKTKTFVCVRGRGGLPSLHLVANASARCDGCLVALHRVGIDVRKHLLGRPASHRRHGSHMERGGELLPQTRRASLGALLVNVLVTPTKFVILCALPAVDKVGRSQQSSAAGLHLRSKWKEMSSLASGLAQNSWNLGLYSTPGRGRVLFLTLGPPFARDCRSETGCRGVAALPEPTF